MAADRQTIRVRVKRRLSNRSDLTDAQLDEYLNAGILELSTRLVIPDLQVRDTSATLTATSNTVSYPSGMVSVDHIRNTTKDWELYRIDWTTIRAMKLVSGDPRQWAAYGRTIYLDRLASTADALDIFGQRRPSWGAANGAAHGLQDEYEYGIELLAAIHAHRDLGESTKAAITETGEFEPWVRRNKFPRLTQGAAPLMSGIQPVLTGYEVVN